MGKRVNLASLAVEDLYEPEMEDHPVRFDLTAVGRSVPVDEVALNPLNKRPVGQDDDIEALAETLRGSGVIQPLVVSSAPAYLREFPDQAGAVGAARWVVLIGNRRLQAARLAPLAEVPIVVNDDQVTSMYEVMLIENGQRRELPPTLEAEAMAEVLKATECSQRELARRLGKSHVYVAQRLSLLKLLPELRTAVDLGELKIEVARDFADLSKAEQRKIVAAGRPYRRPGGNGVTSAVPSRTIRVSTPAAAADSIRKRFSPAELAELIKLLTET